MKSQKSYAIEQFPSGQHFIPVYIQTNIPVADIDQSVLHVEFYNHTFYHLNEKQNLANQVVFMRPFATKWKKAIANNGESKLLFLSAFLNEIYYLSACKDSS